MQNLFRRPSGVYVFRLTVPLHLRSIVGKREVLKTTGTSELTIAKMVASSLTAQWLQHFVDADRLLAVANPTAMSHQEILKIAHGHPALLGGGHLQLRHAAGASGIAEAELLRAAADNRLSLFARVAHADGYLIPRQQWELVEPALGVTGGIVIPPAASMHPDATRHRASGVLRVFQPEVSGLVAELLAGANFVASGLFTLADHGDALFAVDLNVLLSRDNLEVAASEIESLRGSVLALVDPAQIKEAKALHKAALQGTAVKLGRRANESLSKALDAYVTNRVTQDVSQPGEIQRIRSGCQPTRVVATACGIGLFGLHSSDVFLGVSAYGLLA